MELINTTETLYQLAKTMQTMAVKDIPLLILVVIGAAFVLFVTGFINTLATKSAESFILYLKKKFTRKKRKPATAYQQKRRKRRK